VARHRDRSGFGLAGDAKPAANAADLHQVGHDEIACARRDRFREAAWKPPVLSGFVANG
jgi:hypothetical protein